MLRVPELRWVCPFYRYNFQRNEFVSPSPFHGLREIGFNKKWQTHRNFREGVFLVIVGVEFRRFLNLFTWPFLSYIDFSVSHVNLHFKYLAVFWFFAFIWTHWRPVAWKKYPKYGFLSKIARLIQWDCQKNS